MRPPRVLVRTLGRGLRRSASLHAQRDAGTVIRRIEVVWSDAAMDVDYHGPQDGAGTLVNLRRIGYFLGRKRDPKTKRWFIAISNELGVDDDYTREPMAIPAEGVVEITELSEGKKGDLKWFLARAKSRK